LQIFSAGMQKKVNVNIDQPGKQRGVAEVDYFGAPRTIHGCAYGANAVALDKNFARRKQRAGVDLKKAGSVEHDRGNGRLLCGSRIGKRQSCDASKRKRCPKQPTETKNKIRHE
jgi:hypothetical protein